MTVSEMETLLGHGTNPFISILVNMGWIKDFPDKAVTEENVLPSDVLVPGQHWRKCIQQRIEFPRLLGDALREFPSTATTPTFPS